MKKTDEWWDSPCPTCKKHGTMKTRRECPWVNPEVMNKLLEESNG